MVHEFVARRREEWAELETLIKTARGRRIAKLPAEQIVNMGRLYQRAVSDLAIGRRDFPEHKVTLYLNQLVARAHATVYRTEIGEWRQLTDFYRRGLPALFRDALPFTIAAFVAMLVPALATFFAVLASPDNAYYLLPGDMIAQVRDGKMWTENVALPSQLMSSAIMTNNIRVSLVAFAGGIGFGLPTFLVLVLNGLSLGAAAGLTQAYGLGPRLWSFVAPHGVIELTMIFMAGGAGLRLGYALLRPGLLARRAALVITTRQSVKLLFGCVPFLVIAGVIEGFVSPSALPPAEKLLFGALTGMILYPYLLLAGRERR